MSSNVTNVSRLKKYIKSINIKPSTKEIVVLSAVVVEALQNGEPLIELYRLLNELRSKAIPQVIQVSPTEFIGTYGDEFNELAEKLHQEINFRQEQIVSFYK